MPLSRACAWFMAGVFSVYLVLFGIVVQSAGEINNIVNV